MASVVVLKLVIFIGLWNASSVLAGVDVLARWMTDNITNGETAVFDGTTWKGELDSNLKQGVKTVEKIDSLHSQVANGASCVKELDSSCGNAVGVQFWLRYKGFISDILGDNTEYHTKLSFYLRKETPANVRWLTCFNSRHHGWSMDDFHTRCDKKGPTVSLFKVRDDAIFGGFTTASWGGSSQHAYKGFLFSLKNADNKTVPPLALKNNTKAIRSEPGKGPIFGDNDVVIGANPEQDGSSNCHALGTHYNLPSNYITNTDATKNLLAGSAEFGLSAMEVFYMECSKGLGMESGRILDSSLESLDPGLDKNNVRLKSAVAFSRIGSFLRVNLPYTYFVTGVAVNSQSCTSFSIKYNNGSGVEKDYEEEDGVRKEFVLTANTRIRYVFRSPISTRAIKFVVGVVNSSCQVAVEIYGCDQGSCDVPLGMESQAIRDSQLSASNSKDKHEPAHGRVNLNLGGGNGCWDASAGDWLQVDLQVVTIVTSVGIQGCAKDNHHPNSIKLEYGVDNNHFVPYTGTEIQQQIFSTDDLETNATVKKLQLNPPIAARYIRFFPSDREEMRVELYGCDSYKNFQHPTTLVSTGKFFRGDAIGFAVSVFNSNLHGNALTSNKSLKIQRTSSLSIADWTRITYWVDLGFDSGVLFENEQKATISSQEDNSSNFSPSPYPFVIIDHSSFTTSSNNENLQLSDITIWKADITDDDALKTAVDKIVDGPVILDVSSHSNGGSSSVPYITQGWTVLKQCTPSQSKGTGPCIGSASGAFLYLEASNGVEGARAYIESYHRVSAYKCFSFAYHMWGQNVGRLNVYVKDFYGENKLVWRLGGNQGNQWHTAKVPLSQPRAFKIIMEGVVGDGFQGDIAVDSFHFMAQSCVSTPPAASPTYSTGFSHSRIIGVLRQAGYLMNLLNNVSAPNAFWKPCFIKSRDNSVENFWINCKNKGPTVLVGKKGDNVFGAYSDRDWAGSPGKDPSSQYNISSSKAFIFSLTNPSSTPKVFPVNPSSRYQAIQINDANGPGFGQGLRVDSSLKVRTNLGQDYGSDPSADATYLAGTSSITPDELEVLYASDFPCDKWCALPDWKCKESNAKCECDYTDRLIGSCLRGQPQAFLGLFDSYERSPDAYWNLDVHPEIIDLKTQKRVRVSSGTKQVTNGISRRAIHLDGTARVELGDYAKNCIFDNSSAGLSVSIWIKYESKAGIDSQNLFTIGHSADGESRLQISHSNSASEELSVMVNVNRRRIAYRFFCPSNIWSHLVISWTSNTGSLVVYRNGKAVDLEYDICYGCPTTGSSDTSIYLGDQTAGPVSFDEIGIWCKGLIGQEAEEIFRFFQGPPGFHVFIAYQRQELSASNNSDESDGTATVKNNIITQIKLIVDPSNISFACGGSSYFVCNITIGADFADGDTGLSLYNGGLKNNILSYYQTGVSTKKITLGGHNASAESINVTLDMPSTHEDDQWSGIYQGYALFYHPLSDPSLILNVTEERYVTAWNLVNLTGYTPYNVTLRLHYLGGTYRTLNTIIWTGEKAPETPPLNFEAMPMNASCIKIQWQDSEAQVPGRIRGFQIQYNQSNQPSLPTKTLNVYYFNQTIYEHAICDLAVETEYHIHVAAFTVGLGPFTEPKSAWTTGLVPALPPVSIISHNGTGPNDPTSTCLITWNHPPPESTNGNLTSYRIVYTNMKGNTTFYSEIGVCNITKLLRELKIYSVYKVILASANTKGHSPYSEPVYCHTEGTVPGAPPSSFRAQATSPTSCRLEWGQVPDDLHNGLILGYNITFIKQDEPDAELNFVVVPGILSNTTELLGLEKFTKYNISIAAFTKKGLGNESGLHLTECLTWEATPDAVPENLDVIEKNNVSCKLSWSAIPPDLGNGIILGYEATIENANATDPESVFSGFQITCPTSLSARFNNLRPFHMYNITVAGFNSRAVSNKSETLQCLTDEDQPLIPPPNLRCQMKTSTVIEVCWDEIPLILRQGIIREYKVFYQILNQSWWYTKSITKDIISTSPALCWNVTDLEEYSSYSLKVKAVTVKEGNFSYEPVECKTDEGAPREAPINVIGYNTSAYSLMVEWGDVPREQPGIIQGYVVYWRIWNASEDTAINTSVPLSPKKLHITSLKLFTMYCVKVAAVTVAPGPMSNCTYIFTDSKWLPPPDGIPSNITELFNSTETNCSLRWQESNNSNPDPDGRVLGYNVYYRIAGTNDTETVIQVKGPNTTQQVLQSLEEYMNYEIRVAAYNLYGAGNKSEIMYCHTKEDAPSEPPPNITAINASSTSIRINWFDIPRFEQNGIIRWYFIVIFETALVNTANYTSIVLRYRPSNLARRHRRDITIDEHTQTISGLKKFTEYGVQLYGYTIKEGPLSPVVYVKTAEDAPTMTVRNLTIRNSSSSSILLEWNNVPPDHWHGIIRSFVIYYWRTDWPLIEEQNITVNKDHVRVATGRRRRRSLSSTPDYRFNLTGLGIWTNYSLQVAAKTVKVGLRTNETLVSTDEDVPCLPPHYITFDIPAPFTVRIHWNDVIRHCRNGIILGYRLIYQEMPNKPPVMFNFTASDRHYDIKNMNADANYTFKMMAFTRKGDGNSSFDLAQPDRMGPRHKPINVTTFNFTTPTTLNVEWKPIEDPLTIEKLMGYRVSWKVLSEGEETIEDAPWTGFTVRKNTLNTVITGLKNFAHYQIEVSGFTRGGNGPSGVVWGDTCRCFKRVTTNYRIFSPYNSVSISKDLKSINMSGMIPEILNNLTTDCCQTCQAHGASFVDFVQNGRSMSAFQHNELDVQALIDNTNDLSFPVYGWKWQNRYQEVYRYIPLVESPGFAFLLLQPETESPLIAIVNSIINTWPYLLITLMMALLAGIIMWFLDTAYNEEQFPHNYFKGAGNGWWWAFISMTTLGYGDRCPAANHSKAFAVIWVLMGLVVYGILSGSITTAFTTIIYQSSTRLYGSKVATIADTPEYRFAVRRNAKVNTEANYTTFEEVLQALIDKKVTGMLMDAYEAGTKREQFLKSGGRIRIHKVYDFASTFGVVLAGPSTRLYQCSRNWMSSHRAEMSSHIAKFIQVVEEEKVNELVEITTGLFDPDSSVFQSFLKYSLIALAVLAVPGIIWEIYYQTNKRKRNKLAGELPAYIQKEKLVNELGEFTTHFLEDLESKLVELQEKHKAELRLLRRQRHLKGDDYFQHSKGLLPLDRLKDKKVLPTR